MHVILVVPTRLKLAESSIILRDSKSNGQSPALHFVPPQTFKSA